MDYAYLVYEDCGYDGTIIIGIASSLEEGLALLEKVNKLDSRDIIIDRYEVNSPEEPKDVYNATFKESTINIEKKSHD
jgi:hypothetical protein